MGNNCAQWMDHFVPNQTLVWEHHPDAVACYQFIGGRLCNCKCRSSGPFELSYTWQRPPGKYGTDYIEYIYENGRYKHSSARHIIEEALQCCDMEYTDPWINPEYYADMEIHLNENGWAEKVNHRLRRYGYQVHAEVWAEMIDDFDNMNIFFAIFVDKTFRYARSHHKRSTKRVR